MRRTPHAVLALACALLCTSFCTSFCTAQPIDDCPAGAGEAPNRSRLCVRLNLKEGRVYFDRSQSRFTPSAQFTARLGVTPAAAAAAVYAELDRIMRLTTEPYRLALSDEEKRLGAAAQGALAPPALRNFSGEFLDAGYMAAFDEWASSVPGRIDFATVVSVYATAPPDGLVVPLITAHEKNGLLIYEDGSYDPSSAFISFFVADPISDLADASQLDIRLPGLTDPSAVSGRLNKLRGVLGRQVGRPRCGLCIERRLVAYYRDLGLSAQVRVDNASGSPLVVSVIEAPRVVGVSWLSLTEADEPDVDKVLYSLLTDRAFRLSLREEGACTKSDIRAAKQFNYQKCTGRPGPYLSLPALQVQQQLVNQLGYTVSVAPAPGDADAANYVLVFQKTSGHETTGGETPEAAPALADEKGHVEAHEQEKEGATEHAPETETRRKGQQLGDKKYFLGGGLEYRPGQGARLFGLGQRSRLPLPLGGVSSLSATGGAQGDDGALGAINFFSDYVFFNSLDHRRISVQLTINSDIEADRALAPAPLDERRRSGVGRVELELFRDRGGQLLRFYAEGRRDTVELRPAVAPSAPVVVARQNLTTLDLGALYVFESRGLENARRARFEPRLRAGLGLAAGEPRFNRWSLTGAFHQKLPRRFELDFGGRFEAAGRATPLFELPSFGGSDVVRGFRRDDALGRRLWSLQNELWVPLPVSGGDDDATEGLRALLRQSVKLAPFVDVGGLYDAVRGRAGARVGAGLGLRLVRNPIVFKIDYGYGFGDAATGGRRGKLHVGVVSNLPF